MSEEQLLDELVAIDAPSDPDDADVDHPDPEDAPFDPEPDAEGDDTEVQEAIG